MPLLLGIHTILVWLGGVLGAAALTIISRLTTDYAFKIATVALAITTFIVFFKASYSTVKNVLDSAVSYAASYSGSAGAGIQFGLCLIPSSISLAITTLFNIAITAVVVRWVRTVLFAKIA